MLVRGVDFRGLEPQRQIPASFLGKNHCGTSTTLPPKKIEKSKNHVFLIQIYGSAEWRSNPFAEIWNYVEREQRLEQNTYCLC